jgi:two-component sensor histidine kinase
MRRIVVDRTTCDPVADPANERDVTQDQLDPSIGLLIRELQHRIQNLFAVVQCFVNQTDSATAPEYRAALSARIASLADAYKLIERTRSRRIFLTDLLEQTLRPYATTGRPDRICARGPDIELEPKLALSLHMVFHELATNASKHGALSALHGRVEAVWELVPGLTGRALAMQWRERGGPEVREPDREGFGLRLVTKVLVNSQVELTFDRAGLVCRMLIQIDSSQTSENSPTSLANIS